MGRTQPPQCCWADTPPSHGAEWESPVRSMRLANVTRRICASNWRRRGAVGRVTAEWPRLDRWAVTRRGGGRLPCCTFWAGTGLPQLCPRCKQLSATPPIGEANGRRPTRPIPSQGSPRSALPQRLCPALRSGSPSAHLRCSSTRILHGETPPEPFDLHLRPRPPQPRRPADIASGAIGPLAAHPAAFPT